MPGFKIPLNDYTDKCNDAGNAILAATGPSHTRETVRSYRYEVSLRLIKSLNKSQEISLFAKTCQRPSPEFDEITIHHKHEEIYRPGKIRWNPINIVFYEALDTDSGTDLTAQTIYDWWSRSIYNVNTQKQVTVREIYENNCTISMQNGTGTVCWKYSLYNAWPQKISAKDCDYTGSDISEISVNVKYNKATEEK
jgi:hypothetical protein